MALSATELQNLANASLDFHLRGAAQAQVLQNRPLYDDLTAGKKEFPAGKEFITEPVKGVYSSAMRGYDHDDEQEYINPANIRRTQIKWYETSSGISTTFTELKRNGISVTDDENFQGSTVTQGEMLQLTNIFDDKIEDLTEGTARSLHEMFWRDGTQDAKAIPGILSFILDAPTTGTTFGIDRAANSWWRNRASVSINSATASDQNLVNTLQKEFRQLRRYAKKPMHKFYAGSDFMDAFEKELRSKGNYTLEGWSKQGKIDASVADLAFKGIDIQYEPMLDDLSRAKYGYVLDMNQIKLRPMAGGEWMKRHTPKRPVEKYAMYMALTCTGAISARQLNSSGVYAIL
jgi:hypothetical protein